MNFAFVGLGLAAACMTVRQPDPATYVFQPEIPAYSESEQIHLLLRDVVVPRNQPIRFRAYALVHGGGDVYLGTGVIPGIARDATGVTKLAILRIDVTNGFRQWHEQQRSLGKVDLKIVASIAGGGAAKKSCCSIRSAELVRVNQLP